MKHTRCRTFLLLAQLVGWPDGGDRFSGCLLSVSRFLLQLYHVPWLKLRLDNSLSAGAFVTSQPFIKGINK